MTSSLTSGGVIDPACGLMLRWGLALIFAQAAFHKGRDLPGFRSNVASYRLLPRKAVGVVAILLVGGEAIVSLALLLPFEAGGHAALAWVPLALAPLALALLILVYTLAIAINLLRGRRHFDCGCTGPGAKRPIGGDLLIRNLVLIALAGVAALPALAREVYWIDTLTAVAGAMVIALLYEAANRAMANAGYARGPAVDAPTRTRDVGWSVAP